MCDFEIVKDIETIGTKGKALKLVRWGDSEARYDLRMWRQEGGELKPGKGITLTETEARELQAALTDCLYNVS